MLLVIFLASIYTIIILISLKKQLHNLLIENEELKSSLQEIESKLEYIETNIETIDSQSDRLFEKLEDVEENIFQLFPDDDEDSFFEDELND